MNIRCKQLKLYRTNNLIDERSGGKTQLIPVLDLIDVIFSFLEKIIPEYNFIIIEKKPHPPRLLLFFCCYGRHDESIEITCTKPEWL